MELLPLEPLFCSFWLTRFLSYSKTSELEICMCCTKYWHGSILSSHQVPVAVPEAPVEEAEAPVPEVEEVKPKLLHTILIHMVCSNFGWLHSRYRSPRNLKFMGYAINKSAKCIMLLLGNQLFLYIFNSIQNSTSLINFLLGCLLINSPLSLRKKNILRKNFHIPAHTRHRLILLSVSLSSGSCHPGDCWQPGWWLCCHRICLSSGGRHRWVCCCPAGKNYKKRNLPLDNTVVTINRQHLLSPKVCDQNS